MAEVSVDLGIVIAIVGLVVGTAVGVAGLWLGHGRNPAFRQIGNAVPPLLVKSLAAHMLRELRDAMSRPGQRDAAEVG